jgi:hypothetical protein
MKRLLAPLFICTCVMLSSGCGGGSGTPLPTPQKTAKIAFYAISTAHNFSISDYVISASAPSSNIVLPSGLTVPIEANTSSQIATGYLKGFFSNLAVGSFIPSSGDGTVQLTVSNLAFPPAGIGFGKFSELTCVLSSPSMTKQSIFAAYTSKNPSVSRIARAKMYNPATPGISPEIPVFYNISVSVQ